MRLVMDMRYGAHAGRPVQSRNLVFAMLLLMPAFAVRFTYAGNATQAEVANWTVLIPDRFPNYVYSWRLKTDGRYEEDGRDRRTGRPIQNTLTGHWSANGQRMILRQDTIHFVFDGQMVGSHYTGTLYLNGDSFSRFCAVRGEAEPESCDTVLQVSMLGTVDFEKVA